MGLIQINKLSKGFLILFIGCLLVRQMFMKSSIWEMLWKPIRIELVKGMLSVRRLPIIFWLNGKTRNMGLDNVQTEGLIMDGESCRLFCKMKVLKNSTYMMNGLNYRTLRSRKIKMD